jgi:hypothetical protein
MISDAVRMVRFVKASCGQKIGEISVEPACFGSWSGGGVRRLASVETLPIDLEENWSTIKRKVTFDRWKTVFVLSRRSGGCDYLEEEEISRAFSNIDVEAKGFAGKHIGSHDRFRDSVPSASLKSLWGTDRSFEPRRLAWEHSVPWR